MARKNNTAKPPTSQRRRMENAFAAAAAAAAPPVPVASKKSRKEGLTGAMVDHLLRKPILLQQNGFNVNTSRFRKFVQTDLAIDKKAISDRKKYLRKNPTEEMEMARQVRRAVLQQARIDRNAYGPMTGAQFEKARKAAARPLEKEQASALKKAARADLTALKKAERAEEARMKREAAKRVRDGLAQVKRDAAKKAALVKKDTAARLRAELKRKKALPGGGAYAAFAQALNQAPNTARNRSTTARQLGQTPQQPLDRYVGVSGADADAWEKQQTRRIRRIVYDSD